MSRLTGRLLACAGLFFIAGTTLVPIPQQELAARLTPWWCLICGDHGGQDVINNVLLFIPFALGLRLAGLPSRTVVVTGGLVSLSVELLQWGVVAGRDASLSDVLTNTLGSLVGAMVAIIPGPAAAAEQERRCTLSHLLGCLVADDSAGERTSASALGTG